MVFGPCASVSRGCRKPPPNTRCSSLPAGIHGGTSPAVRPAPGSRGHGILAFRREGGACLPLPESAWAVAVLHQIPNCLKNRVAQLPAAPGQNPRCCGCEPSHYLFPSRFWSHQPTAHTRFPSDPQPATLTLRHSLPDSLVSWFPGFPTPNAAGPTWLGPGIAGHCWDRLT